MSPASSSSDSSTPIRSVESPDRALAVPARAGPDLFLGVLLAALPDTRTDRQRRHSSRHRVSGGGRALLWPSAPLVCAIAVLALDRQRLADGRLLDWPDSRRCCWFSISGRAGCWWFASSAFCRLLRRPEISPAISRTACCWRQASSPGSLHLRDFGQAGAKHIRRRAPACFCCSGSGFAFTSSRAL